jgi:thiosulfate dehydrogenase [quinone] large subunit
MLNIARTLVSHVNRHANERRTVTVAMALTMLRMWLGWQWINAGLLKVQDADWMTGSGVGLMSFWQYALASKGAAGPTIVYDWYRAFLQLLVDSHANTWFAQLIALGELGVGAGLLLGALVPIAALGGLTMNMAYMLAGVTSINPVLALVAGVVFVGRRYAGVVGLNGLLGQRAVLARRVVQA